MAGRDITIAQAVGRFSQVAVLQYHPHTVRSLVERLQPLVAVAGPLAVNQLTPELLRRAVPQGHRHPERVRQAQASFLDFCAALEWINVGALNRPTSRDGLTLDDWRRLLHIIPESWQGARDRLLLTLTFYMGLPLAVIRALTRDTFTPNQTQISGAWVPNPPEVEDAALNWYSWRHGLLTPAVFITPGAQPDPLYERTINRRLARYCERAVINPPVTVHQVLEAGRHYRHILSSWTAPPAQPESAVRPGFRRVDFAQLLRHIRGTLS